MNYLTQIFVLDKKNFGKKCHCDYYILYAQLADISQYLYSSFPLNSSARLYSHGCTGKSPMEGHQDDLNDGLKQLLWGEAERVGTAQPGKDKAQGEFYQCI